MVGVGAETVKQLSLAIRTAPTHAEVREEVRARLTGLEYRQAARDERRRKAAVKRQMQIKLREMEKTGVV